MEKELRSLLPQLSALFGSEEFDASLCYETFSKAMPSLLGSLMMPSLASHIFKVSPHSNLIEISAKSNPFDLLDSGKLDFAVYYSEQNNKKYRSRLLGTIYPELFVGKQHPLAYSNPNIAQIMQYPFVAMTVEEDHKQAFNAPLSRLFRDYGIQVAPELKSTQTQVLLDVAKRTDSVIFGMNALKHLPDFEQHFVPIYQFKQAQEYHVQLFLIEHQRVFHSPAHQWFASQIEQQTMAILE
ncbi:LysR substrate-binding domain-containing protein [Vibrio gallicus]|uniref:LysR substrate-binding domain-containing protein n=1 Tax=Vibrio gallicus TaxID=190897 RepID=UPI0021C36C86|nr:LysR substrate-binding domain-containing protein [Vibrio gallicus]